MSSNVVPRLRISVRMHRGAPPAVYRSGATATKPAPAKRSVCWRTSSARPSCKTTPLGHGPLPSGGTTRPFSAARHHRYCGHLASRRLLHVGRVAWGVTSAGVPIDVALLESQASADGALAGSSPDP
jgi:hypothetical protein